jgi:type II secretion system protein N
MKFSLKRWQRWTAYGLFAVLAFAFALRQTFPTDAVKERLVLEAAAQGWQLTIADVRPAGFAGIGMSGLTLESRDGLRIPVERVDASLRLLPLLLGRRGVSFDATVFEGKVQGFAEEGKDARRLVATVSGLDLTRAVPLRKATGVDLAGTMRGNVDLTFDEKQPARSAGQLDLLVEGAAVNGGEMPVPGMGGAFTLPRIGLGQVTAKASVKEGKLTFDRLDSRGDDLEATGEGLYLVLQPRLGLAPIFGKARVRIRDAFWGKAGTSAFKPVVEMALAQARGGDGSYGFQIFGTVSHPQARMSP